MTGRVSRWCSEILGKVSRLLDRIAPPFTEPAAIEDEIAWLKNSNYVAPPRELADDDYIVLANNQETEWTERRDQ